MAKKRLNKTKLVKEIARERIGVVRPTQREERSDEQNPDRCPDCRQQWERCYCCYEQ